MSSVLERVQTILVDRLGVEQDEVREDAKLRDDLGADSLDMVEIVMELEDEFNVDISDEDAEKLIEGDGTVGAIVRHLTSRIRD